MYSLLGTEFSVHVDIILQEGGFKLGGLAAELAPRACRLLDHVMAEHLQVFFGQHIAVLVACR